VFLNLINIFYKMFWLKSEFINQTCCSVFSATILSEIFCLYKRGPCYQSLHYLFHHTYMEPNYWGTTSKNSPCFWGSHLWTTIFPTENGSHLANICHFLPVSCSHSCYKASLEEKMWAQIQTILNSFFEKQKPTMAKFWR
jgi:hypothetical protein